MKNLLLLLFAAFSLQAFAQEVPDQTRTNCSNQTESLHDQLNANKVVLVAADGFDCSICQNHAPSIGTYATNNPNIRVWGALGFKYSSAQPTCTQANNWSNSYDWRNVFSFLDANRSWAGNGYPTYTVIDPRNKTIAYRGTSHTQAMNRATEIANEIVTSSGSFIAEPAQGISANCCNRTVSFKGFSKPVSANLYIYNLQGKIVQTIENLMLSDGFQYNLNNEVPSGMYVLSVVMPGSRITGKIMVSDHE